MKVMLKAICIFKTRNNRGCESSSYYLFLDFTGDYICKAGIASFCIFMQSLLFRKNKTGKSAIPVFSCPLFPFFSY